MSYLGYPHFGESDEERSARMARLAEEQEKLRQEQENRRLKMDEARLQQKIAEESQVRKLAVYTLGGLGVLVVITLILKLIFKP